MEREVAWNHYSEEEKKKVFEFAEEYQHVRQKENVYALL